MSKSKKKKAGMLQRLQNCLVHDGFHFDKTAAEQAVWFFPRFLTHQKGELAGHPFKLEGWQEWTVRQIFGWKDRKGFRQYSTVYIEVPRKNGKSTWAAGLALLVMYVDKEPGAEVYCAACDKSQAALVFEIASGMVTQSPELLARAEVFKRSIILPRVASSFKVLSADVKTKHGLNPHCAVVDELHAHPNRELFDVVTTGTGARRQPLVIIITTAGWDRTSICWELHDFAGKVRDGIVKDPTFLPLIVAADPEDPWDKPKTWKKANPNYGVSLKPGYFRKQVARAQESPAFLNTFKRLHLNIWTEGEARFLDMDRWKELEGFGSRPLSLEYGKDLHGKKCWAGLDLSATKDVTALVLLFPDEEDGIFRVLPFFWVPRETARAREQHDRVPYMQWARDGWLEVTEGNVIDYDRIRERVNELGQVYDIQDIAVDRWQAVQIMVQLQGDGFEVTPFGQGFASMSSPTKELEKLVLEGTIGHGGNPVLQWMASNVVVETDAAGNYKPSKKKSQEKIDGIVALIMALGRYHATQPDEPSVYEEQGIVFI